MNCIISVKTSYLIEYSSYEKAVFMITEPLKMKLLKFRLFSFSNFQTTFVKNVMKNLPGFKIDFESTDKVSPLLKFIDNETTAL